MGTTEPKPGLAQRLGQLIEADRKKIGGMTLGAHARLGLAEVREVFSHGASIAQPTPHGMWGTLTPGEVAAERRDDPLVQKMEQEPIRPDGQPHGLTPGEIARDGGIYGPAKAQPKGLGEGLYGPTPSQIAKDNTPDRQGPERSHRLDMEHGRERGR